MSSRGHRRLTALLLVLVLVGLVFVLPNALAQRQITGLVSDCANNTIFIGGARVTLIDANGVLAPQTATTGPAGTYVFTPPPASYRMHVDAPDYFEDTTPTPIRFDGGTTIRQDFCLDHVPTPPDSLTVTVIRATDSSPILNASVELFYAPRSEVVARGKTDAAGVVTLTVWSDTFELRTNRSGFAVDIRSVNTGAVSSVTVPLGPGAVLVGQATDSQGSFISAGLNGTLYNVNPSVSLGAKIIWASVQGSSYTFNAPPGTYIMSIDANGFATQVTTQILTGGSIRVDAVLQPSAREEYRAIVRYGAADWNNLTIYRNQALNADTSYPGLLPIGLRNLGLQVDFTFGTSTSRDGTVSPAESAAFLQWLHDNGPFYVTTDGFFTTNGKAYISNASLANYNVTLQGLTPAGSPTWINSTALYALKQLPYIPTGRDRYFTNMTMQPDRNVTVYQDQVYEVWLPVKYEMATNVTTGPVRTSGFTRVTVDPGIAATSPQIRMTVELSEAGTARGKIAGPAGKFHVINPAFDNYQALVANNTSLTFSGEDSTDPVGDITQANFTWRPYANATEPSLSGVTFYGLTANFTYTRAGRFIVNLTVVQGGGNTTSRNMTLFVDDQFPIPKFRTNRTGSGPVANGTTVRTNQHARFRFDGGLSTDMAYVNATYGGTRAGTILDTGYAWDFDEDNVTDLRGRVVNYTFDTAGNFTVNLTVTDSVGWKAGNISVIFIVNDTTPPVPRFVIRDPALDYDIADALIENRPYSFNASDTTDNFDKPDQLNYTWTIPGPVQGRTGTTHTFYGMNISFTWTEFNSSYSVVLKVNDTGFAFGKKNTGTLTRSVTVQIDSAARPNLIVDQRTLKVTPTDPPDGSVLEVRVNVTNQLNRGIASQVTTQLNTIVGGVTSVLTTTSQWLNRDGTTRTNGTINPGETITVVFRATISGIGNKTVQAYIFDANEAWTQRSDNRASTSVVVVQSILQTIALAGAIAGVLGLFVFYMIYRRKVRAGEWKALRVRRAIGLESEGKKPKKEVKEEKKRL